MSRRKHHLLDERDTFDYRQVAASVRTAVRAPERPRGRRLIPQTNPISTPPEDKSNTGMNTGIPSQGRQASAVPMDESMSVFFQANTGGHRPRPIPRMPEGLGIESNSNEA